MTTRTLTLTEFLLARIAEDEGNARSLGGELRGTAWQGGAGTPERVLAECEAKRRIVEDFEVLHRDYRETHSPITEARRFQARVAQARLAEVYADHPDYREEWKP